MIFIPFYPTDFKGSAGIVLIHDVRLGSGLVGGREKLVQTVSEKLQGVTC